LKYLLSTAEIVVSDHQLQETLFPGSTLESKLIWLNLPTDQIFLKTYNAFICTNNIQKNIISSYHGKLLQEGWNFVPLSKKNCYKKR
jgi:hypothetical protein